MLKFDIIFNKIIKEQNLYFQEASQQQLKQLHDIFITVYDKKDKAEQKWNKYLKNDKVLVFDNKKNKVRILKKIKFDNDPDKFLKYAKSFMSSEQQQLLNKDNLEQKLKEFEDKAKSITTKVKNKQLSGNDGEKQLKQLYEKTKTDQPDIAEKAKDIAKKGTQIIKSKSTVTKKEVHAKLSGEIVHKIQKIPVQIANDIKYKFFIFKDYINTFNDKNSSGYLLYKMYTEAVKHGYIGQSRSSMSNSMALRKLNLYLSAIAAKDPEIINKLQQLAKNVFEKMQDRSKKS